MSKILHKKKQSSVKILIGVFSVLIMQIPSQSFAADGGMYAAPLPADKQLEVEAGKKSFERCDESEKEFNEANKKLTEACIKAGLKPNCGVEAMQCAATIAENSYSTLDVLNAALGTGVPSVGSGTNATCPQHSGKTYFDEKTRLEKELKDLQKDIADFTKEQGDAQDSFNKTIAELQSELADANKEYQKLQLSSKDEARKREAEFMQNQQQNQKSLRDLGSKLLSQRSALSNIQLERVDKLSSLVEKGGDAACLAKVRQVQSQLKALGAASSKAGSALAQSKQNNKTLVEQYKNCMVKFNNEHDAITKNAEQQTEAMMKQINDTQSEMDTLENNLRYADSQLAQIKADAQTELTNAQSDLTSLMARLQSKMQAAQSSLNSTLQSIAQKQQATQAAILRVQESVRSLGPAPARSSEISQTEAAGQIDQAINDKIRALEKGAAIGKITAKTTAPCTWHHDAIKKDDVYIKSEGDGKYIRKKGDK